MMADSRENGREQFKGYWRYSINITRSSPCRFNGGFPNAER